MENLLKFLVESLVDDKSADKSAVEVSKEENEKSVTFRVKVAENDIGKVIGKNGKTANSIRTILKSVSAKEHKKIFVKFED